MRKETLGMIFDLFSSRILSLNNHEHLKKKKKRPKKLSQNRLQIVRGEMKITSVHKTTLLD